MNGVRRPVSVIMPARDAAPTIDTALRSALPQLAHNDEVIVVDDGSTDDTAARAARLDPRVRVLRQANAGPAAARNAALATATGRVIAFLDADDVWPAGKLAAQLNALDALPEPAVVLGATQLIGNDDEATPVAGARPGLMLLLGCAIADRAVFSRTGGFAPALRIGEDLDWFMRVRELALPLGTIDRVTLGYRLRPGSTVHGRSWHELNFAQVLKRSLDRRRAAGRPGDLPPVPRGDAP